MPNRVKFHIFRVFSAKDKTQDELFRVLKNFVATHWGVKTEEAKLHEANDGIRSKLCASTPVAIIVRSTKDETIKHYDLDQRFGCISD